MKEREVDLLFKKQAIFCEKICNRLEEFGYSCKDCEVCCCYNQVIGLLHSEVIAISNHLNISKEEFRRKYTTITMHPSRKVKCRCLKPDIDNDGNEVCVFLNGDRCTIYPVRPHTCMGFPFTLHPRKELISIHATIDCIKTFGFNKLLKEFIKEHQIENISEIVNGVPYIDANIVKQMLDLS